MSADPSAVGEDEKIRFLGAPENYRGHPQELGLLQTHHAWLFLTDKHVYKIKTPTRIDGFDYSSVEFRQQLCEQEVLLNRRLAARCVV